MGLRFLFKCVCPKILYKIGKTGYFFKTLLGREPRNTHFGGPPLLPEPLKTKLSELLQKGMFVPN